MVTPPRGTLFFLALATALLGGGLLLVAEGVDASHFRGMSLGWETDRSAAGDLLGTPVETIEIHGQQVFRASFFAYAPVGSCLQGGAIQFSDGERLSFDLRVDAVDPGRDELVATLMSPACQAAPVRSAPLVGQLADPTGPLVATYDVCCVTSSTVNGPLMPVHVEVAIPLDEPGRAALPEVWSTGSVGLPECPKQSICHLDLGAPGASAYSLSQPCTQGSNCAATRIGAPWSEPMTIDQDGSTTWDTRGATTYDPTPPDGDLYAFYATFQGAGGGHATLFSNLRLVEPAALVGLATYPEQPSAGYEAILQGRFGGPSPIRATSWEFGDGQTASGFTTNHIFAAPGAYNVTVYITAGDGHTYIGHDLVTVIDNKAPVVELSMPETIYQNVPAEFGLDVSDPDGDNVTVAWFFGAGAKYIGNATGATATFPWTFAYGYVRVTDEHGLRVTAQVPYQATAWLERTLDFTVEPEPLYAGAAATFRFTGDHGSALEPPQQSYWTFGDQSPPSEAFEPVHTYVLAGQYTATLRLYDEKQGWINHSVDVTVLSGGPTAQFDVGGQGVRLSFTDMSSDPDGAVVAWYWTFGDGTNSTAQHPMHQYAPGTYTVRLSVWDDDGNAATATRVVTAPL